MTVYRSEALHGEPLGRTAPSGTLIKQALASVTLADNTPLRVLSRRHDVGGRDLVVRVALSEERQRHEWRELLVGLLFGLPVAIAIAGLGGHWLARRVLGPLDRMAKHAERLTAENLGERLPVENPDDELGHLARVFNLSLARIEESFAQLRRFTADASHELRTPLTAIRTVGEVALQDPRNPDHYREAIGSMLEEVDRLSRLVGSLLVLSRADAGPALRRQELRLVELVKDSASLLEVLADEKGQRIEVHGDPGVTAEVDGLILRQALINLIDNAIKYSPRDSLIRIDVQRDETRAAAIAVSDQGPGIPPADRSRVFERFYRIDEARAREDGGAGLGLSIALWAVQAHGGRIDVQSQEGAGSTFRIVLPETSGPPRMSNSPLGGVKAMMRNKALLSAVLVLACGADAADSMPPLKLVADIPMPGDAVRFDYQSLDPASGRLYIAHMNANQLVVFDTHSRKVVANLDGFDRVHGVWAVPDLGRVYASVTGEHRVAVVDMKTLQTITKVGPITYPDGLAYAPGPGRIFVSDEHGKADAVIDARTNVFVTTIPLGGEAGNTVYDPVSGQILVTVHDPAELAVIDPGSAKIVKRYPLPGVKEPHGVALDVNGRLAFGAGQGNHTLAVFDLASAKVLATHPVGEDPDVLAFDPGLRLLYVSSESGTVSVFREHGKNLVSEGEIVMPHAHTVCVDAKTHLVYFPLENVDGHPILRIMEPAGRASGR